MKLQNLLEEIDKSAEMKARDYWDSKLEYNKLRTLRNKTNAGAFIAYRLENAGDILREFGKKYTAWDYVEEKINKISRSLRYPDWTNELSYEENSVLVKIIMDIKRIPDSNSENVKNIKNVLIAIATRRPSSIKADLKKIEKASKNFN